MQLNDIQLSEHLLAALYANSLVVTDPVQLKENITATSEPKEIPAEKLQYLGKNNNRFAILVYYTDQLHLPDESFIFLSNVLKACQLNAADVAIVNLARQSITHDTLLQQLDPRIILDFTTADTMPGLPTATLLQPLKTDLYYYLQSPTLELLNQGGDSAKPQKKQLWEGLKQMLQL